MDGRIELITGCMFSGKSTELMRRVRMHRAARQRVLVITYEKDAERCGRNGLVSSHDREVMGAMPAGHRLAAIDTSDFDVVAIDEGQFFEDLVEFCEGNAAANRIVIVAALDGTFERKPFGPVPHLAPRCESVVKLEAVCMVCYGKAAFSERIAGGNELEEIGGAEKYRAVCRKCWGSGTLLSVCSVD